MSALTAGSLKLYKLDPFPAGSAFMSDLQGIHWQTLQNTPEGPTGGMQKISAMFTVYLVQIPPSFLL